MKIFLVNSLPENYTPIFESSANYECDDKKCDGKKYIKKKCIIFSSGKLLKKAFILNEDICVLCVNLEYFLYKTHFRNVEYEILKVEKKTREDKYLIKEKEYLTNTKKKLTINKLNNNSINKLTINNNSINNNSINVSFYPDIFASIESSLKNPALYLSEKTMAHFIFGILKKNPSKIAEIESSLKNAEIKFSNNQFLVSEIENTLKSLQYASIIKNKEGVFYVSINC